MAAAARNPLAEMSQCSHVHSGEEVAMLHRMKVGKQALEFLDAVDYDADGNLSAEVGLDGAGAPRCAAPQTTNRSAELVKDRRTGRQTDGRADR